MTLHRYPLRFKAASNGIDGGVFNTSALVVTASDVGVSALTFVLSAVVFWFAIRGAPIGIVAGIQCGVICVPATFLSVRIRAG